MEKLATCRVCLAVDVPFFPLLQTPLKEIYERITDVPLTPNAGKPLVVCYICQAHLIKSHILMTRALTAEKIFTQILESGVEITNISTAQCILTANYCTSPIEYFSTAPEKETESDLNVIKSDHDQRKGKDFGLIKTDGQDIGKDFEVNVISADYQEVKTECEDSDVKVKDDDDVIADPDQPEVPPSSDSDSDDNVPLQTISNKSNDKKILVKKKVKLKKKKKWESEKHGKGFDADFAKEIVLTKDQQMQELLDRAKSLNYLNSPMKCELCYKGFVDTRAYDNHKKKHDERSGAHVCEICRMRYSTQRQLRTHTHTSHSRRYQCAKCAHQSHTKNQAREHEKWHGGYTYECKLCGEAFRKPTSYLTHARKRHPTQHVCDMCGGSFVGRHGLLMHKSKAHAGDKTADESTVPASERYCRECNIQFVNRNAWKRHLLTSLTHTQSNQHSPECLICGEWVGSVTSMTSHMRRHERAMRVTSQHHVPPAQLACDQCDLHFVNRSKLQAHVRRKHLGLKYNKNIVCEVCGKKCTSNASLKYHQRTHTGEKPYQCEVCHKRFADNNQLRIHTRTHTGERPYCCGVCGKRFSQKPALNRHYRVHTGAKPYICQFCSKPFSQSNSLKLHVRTVHLKMPANRKNKQDDVDNAQKTEEVTLQTL